MRCEAIDKQKNNVSYVGMNKRNVILVSMITILAFIHNNYYCNKSSIE